MKSILNLNTLRKLRWKLEILKYKYQLYQLNNNNWNNNIKLKLEVRYKIEQMLFKNKNKKLEN